MDNTPPPSHSEVPPPPGTAPGIRLRSTDSPDVASEVLKLRSQVPQGPRTGLRTRFDDNPAVAATVVRHRFDGGTSTETTVGRKVRQVLFRRYLAGGILVAVCCLGMLTAGVAVYRTITYVDPVKPDYAGLDPESDTYWTDRIRIDIDTALQSPGTDAVRQRRLQTFSRRTVADAMRISTPYTRAWAVTSIALVLAQHDIDIILDNQLKSLGETYMIVSMRARVLISRSLLHLRQGRSPAAQVTFQEYTKLVAESDLKLNSSVNEESFFGAVTVLRCLGDKEGLIELFERQKASAVVIGMDQRMRAYRLIAGEQVRVGMIAEALETSKRITNPLELSRAWALIMQYAARPPRILPTEPEMLDLLQAPQTQPPQYPAYADQVAHRIFQHLAESKDINTQVILLQYLAGSRLMCDAVMYQSFRQSLVESVVIQDRVKQRILKLLDDPESPTIRAALNMPPRTEPMPYQMDSAKDDWSALEEIVPVEKVNIDSTPLRTRGDQQWIQALLAMAHNYQSLKRVQDSDRLLNQAFAASQRFVDADVRTQLLLRIGEQQVAAGSVNNARQTFATVFPALNQQQKGELARLQIIARLFEDAFQTIADIESPANREYAASLLVQEQIRINRLADAERTLALMPTGRVAAECRSRLNIANGGTAREDFNTLGLAMPGRDDRDWERYCLGLIQQGCLRLADQSAEGIGSMRTRTDILRRIAREYQLLYQAFNDVNDPNRVIRQEILQAVESIARRTGQPAVQAAILTELLMSHAGQLRTEADRASGKQIWTQAIDACRAIPQPDEQAVLLAQLIVAKNLLENPNLLNNMMPLFTHDTHPQAFSETGSLVTECLELINIQESEEHQGNACIHLARALIQVGRVPGARALLDQVLQDFVPNVPSDVAIPMLLAMVSPLKAMNSTDTISVIYQLVINEVVRRFSGAGSNVGLAEWRQRDSEIVQIIRSQLENGFVDEAVESAMRLNEPVLRDRLFRTAAYIYLDQGEIDQAEWTARRMTVKELQDSVIQNIQTIKRRLPTQEPGM